MAPNGIRQLPTLQERINKARRITQNRFISYITYPEPLNRSKQIRICNTRSSKKKNITHRWLLNPCFDDKCWSSEMLTLTRDKMYRRWGCRACQAMGLSLRLCKHVNITSWATPVIGWRKNLLSCSFKKIEISKSSAEKLIHTNQLAPFLTLCQGTRTLTQMYSTIF